MAADFRTRITACYSDRVETGPDFVPGLPHAVAHSLQVQYRDVQAAGDVEGDEHAMDQRQSMAELKAAIGAKLGWPATPRCRQIDCGPVPPVSSHVAPACRTPRPLKRPLPRCAQPFQISMFKSLMARLAVPKARFGISGALSCARGRPGGA